MFRSAVESKHFPISNQIFFARSRCKFQRSGSTLDCLCIQNLDLILHKFTVFGERKLDLYLDLDLVQ